MQSLDYMCCRRHTKGVLQWQVGNGDQKLDADVDDFCHATTAVRLMPSVDLDFGLELKSLLSRVFFSS